MWVSCDYPQIRGGLDMGVSCHCTQIMGALIRVFHVMDSKYVILLHTANWL
jgi:hypothetical protein